MADSTLISLPALSLCALFLLMSIKYLINQRHGLPLPPSPPGWPLLGNILDIDNIQPWKTYHRWCRHLNSSIIRLNMAGHIIVVLDTYDDCIELLEKKSAIYSGRMSMVMVNELMGWDFNFAAMNYGNVWRDRRRLMHDAFNPVSSKDFRPLELELAKYFIISLQHITDIIPQLQHFASRVIMTITYGIKVKPANDPYIAVSNEAVRNLLNAAVPGKFWVDSIPIFKYVPDWFPGASFKRKARRWKTVTDSMVEGPFGAFLDNTKSGTAVPESFVSKAFQHLSDSGIYTQENIKAVSGTLHQTGSDTIMASLGFCILSLMDRPDIVQKIQEEIDSVTENTRLPNFQDECAYPYLDATIKEVLRYWSFVPLAVPHAATGDDEYKGYRIPQGATVVPNSWAILHNERVFPAPCDFKPERFLYGDNLEEILAHYEVTWGFGRRVCPGRHMAFSMVWITMAQTLAIYNLEKVKDDQGKVIEPSWQDVPSSILTCPPDFHCRFRIRSKEAETLLAAISDSGNPVL